MDATWEKLGFAFAIVALLTVIGCAGIFFQYAFYPKTFAGYYLCHDRMGSYTVYINWDNASDDVAYKTYDGKEVLEVFERLQKCVKPVVISEVKK